MQHASAAAKHTPFLILDKGLVSRVGCTSSPVGVTPYPVDKNQAQLTYLASLFIVA
jgi:hypothetical protein